MPAAQLQPSTYAGKLSKISPHSVIERYLNDEKAADIAESLGVKKSMLNYWLLATSEEDWKLAQIARAVTLRDEAEQELTDLRLPADKDEAPVAQVELARARERLRSAQWQLERLLRRLYGQEQQVSSTQVVIHIGADLHASQQKHENSTEASQVIDVTTNPADRQSVGGPVEGVGEVGK